MVEEGDGGRDQGGGETRVPPGVARENHQMYHITSVYGGGMKRTLEGTCPGLVCRSRPPRRAGWT